ncbi:hypothetical protein GCM10008932_10050 [Alkalibacterium iburiense]|uniref:Bacterial Ig-like domain-containing protein n=1 Tax=Alkalibacterium iburiense TaxID=290589 RepID=A0ABP3H3E2_9LACT
MKAIGLILIALFLNACGIENDGADNLFSFHQIDYSYPFNNPDRQDELNVDLTFEEIEEGEVYSKSELEKLYISVTYEGNSTEIIELGRAFDVLERLDGENWQTVRPVEGYDVPSDLLTLSTSNPTVTIQVSLDPYLRNEDEFKGGTYRVTNQDAVFYFSVGEILVEE